eukprot:scaffold26463_cov25-Prasinocladus_malaysianus.AAC.5
MAQAISMIARVVLVLMHPVQRRTALNGQRLKKQCQLLCLATPNTANYVFFDPQQRNWITERDRKLQETSADPVTNQPWPNDRQEQLPWEHFVPVFQRAWEQTFTTEHNMNDWKVEGILPRFNWTQLP